MKITRRALKNLVREALESSKILRERPWTVEYTFSLSGGNASDSEGTSPDGFSIDLKTESEDSMSIVFDCYWNPQQGDKSGNSIKVILNDEVVASTYVPHRFDDGKKQKAIISNVVDGGVICVSHCKSERETPVTYLVVQNPFPNEQDISFEARSLGTGDVQVDMSDSVNL